MLVDADYESRRAVPRTLWMYWHQGWRRAPDLVVRCAATWQAHNPTWEIRLLDAATIAGTVTLPRTARALALPLPALSDVTRICLLQKYGGVWADATLWCTRPLDDWIDTVTAQSGFFAYDKPGPDRPISSWFLAARSQCRIVDLWHAATVTLLAKTRAHARFRRVLDGAEADWHRLCWVLSRTLTGYLSWRFGYGSLLIPTSDRPKRGDYFWFHYLFRTLLDQNEEFSRRWASTPRISADGPHLLQKVGLLKPATIRTDAAIRNRLSHVFKLSRHVSLPDDISDTVLQTLYRHSSRS